ncbi:hypothetical protein ABZT47_40055 [Sphaerisporangium sp. NPDC005289]|uniref:hypothetical protein n=1 Tax=Sphaerisporangium sp. NPDC005289 TaxID=3155247 RepID=UPI0033A7B14B
MQDDAVAVQAVRLFLSSPQVSDYYDRHELSSAIERACDQADYPDRPVDERERTLAARLREAGGGYVSTYSLAQLLLEHRGVGWLLRDQDLAEPRPGDRIWAAQFLTARYATGQDAEAWRRQLHPMPVAAAVAAARADTGADQTIRLAALTLVPIVRAEQEALLAELDDTELALITGLKDAKTTFARIGEALAISRQGAEQRKARLEKRTMSTTR